MVMAASPNHLKAIRRLRNANERVTTCVLYRHLHVALASVTNMMRRFAADELACYTPYCAAKLTKAGEREAHAEAERLEHAAPSDLVSRIQALLIRRSCWEA
jgi:Mn-dependent DtxR family transcriptional regulator